MALPVPREGSCQSMVSEFFGQGAFLHEQGKNFLKTLLCMSGLFEGASKVFLELLSIANLKH